jgi:hypothetical protein
VSVEKTKTVYANPPVAAPTPPVAAPLSVALSAGHIDLVLKLQRAFQNPLIATIQQQFGGTASKSSLDARISSLELSFFTGQTQVVGFAGRITALEQAAFGEKRPGTFIERVSALEEV